MAIAEEISLKPCNTRADGSDLPMAGGEKLSLKPCATESTGCSLQPCSTKSTGFSVLPDTQAEEAFTGGEGAMKRKSSKAVLDFRATRRKGEYAVSKAIEETAAGNEPTQDEDEDEDDDDDEDADGDEDGDGDGDGDEDEDEEDFDTVYEQCKREHEEHLLKLIANLPFVLKTKDYSIDTEGEEELFSKNEPVVWK